MNLAGAIQRNVVACLMLPNRGAKGRTEGSRGGLMLQRTRAPHVIVEPFFIDNPSDLSVGETCKLELGRAIALGCHQYAGA